MIHRFSRFFQASPVNHSHHVESEDEERALDTTADSGVILEPKPSSHMGSPMERVRAPTPSHVSWKLPSPQPSSALRSDSDWGTQYENRSASAPSLLLLNPSSASSSNQPSSLRRHSSQSLRPQSLTPSEDSDRQSNAEQLTIKSTIKSLSPADERVHFPALRRPSMDSVPLTPDSTRVYDGHSISLSTTGLANYPAAFINRPLNRSVSQTSTSTWRSNNSIAAPTIPPLDLRPDFQATVPLPLRKARLIAPGTLPTVVGTPRPAKVSVIYEDNSSARTSASFITAPSVHTPSPSPGEPSAGPHAYAPSARSGTGTDNDVTPAVRTSVLPEGLYDVDLGAAADAGTPRGVARADTPTPPATATQPLLAIPRAPPSDADTESYIHQRWLKGVSFGSEALVLPSPRRRRAPLSPSCVLFWLGFVAPWCWLIGGWALAQGEEAAADGHPLGTRDVLPLYVRRGKRRAGSLPAERERARAAGKKSGALKAWYPLAAPSAESLSPSVQSRVSMTTARKLRRGVGETIDPWIRRCRIAAVVSGVVILAAFVVALIVVGSKSS
ncbi:hypothetical protein WOLCODRAFT_167192 [Wolfiporia cocos MD-104 SS10]|uniref:Uncharacterized protein n=1 Tax=Wolfiporia cocos (strain MD-104) TaxID=742152 RepID=A0A2H3J3Z3_WOLCO|nr:hypothetical protein WOLCODRAFT_167192 [Wolfiporia cocos MD-104 SS10]